MGWRVYVTLDVSLWQLPRAELTVPVTVAVASDVPTVLAAAVAKANKRYFLKWGCLLEERHCICPSAIDDGILTVHVLHLHCRHWRLLSAQVIFQQTYGVDHCMGCSELFLHRRSHSSDTAGTREWTFCPSCFEMEHASTFAFN
jgi:hypothetical protein